MAWSKKTRISVMLAIDIVFFSLELTTGLAVKSLALTADAFHMLNDIISLVVGLWAVTLAKKASTDKYSYGWLRAEILGAFFNAVFLIGLCVTIVLDAITRLIDPPEITNPQFILVIGCLGLVSNLVGFLVLGGHSHSPEAGEHSHGEEEHAHDDEYEYSHANHRTSLAEEGRGGVDVPERASAERSRDRRLAGSVRQNRLNSIEGISLYPAQARQELIATLRPPIDEQSGTDSSSEEGAIDDDEPHERDSLLKSHSPKTHVPRYVRSPSRQPRHARHARHARQNLGDHANHNHNKPAKPSQKKGHNHGDMGMNAMILHVLGDALGNVGVIATALVIWLTDWSWKYHFDPAVSIFITIVILRTAIPLTKATASILLQATPEHLDPNLIREDIQALPGVVSCHHLHIWQLSDTRIVASMHIQIAFPMTEAGGEKYMTLAKMARKCLHAYGIHGATIQPEFCLDEMHNHAEDAAAGVQPRNLRCGACGDDNCLLPCVEECGEEGCCLVTPSTTRDEHDHDEEEGHIPDQAHAHAHDTDHDHSHGDE